MTDSAKFPWPVEGWNLVIDEVVIGTLRLSGTDQPWHTFDWIPGSEFPKYADYFLWDDRNQNPSNDRASLRLGDVVLAPFLIWIDGGTARLRFSHEDAVRIMEPIRGWRREHG